MDDLPQDLDYTQMPKWFKINETVIVPYLENTMNEMRNKTLMRNSNDHEQTGDTRWLNLVAQFKNEAIAFAIRRYGLRIPPPVELESDEDPPTQAKKMRTDHDGEDDIVASAIESAIAEKGLR